MSWLKRKKRALSFIGKLRAAADIGEEVIYSAGYLRGLKSADIKLIAISKGIEYLNKRDAIKEILAQVK